MPPASHFQRTGNVFFWLGLACMRSESLCCWAEVLGEGAGKQQRGAAEGAACLNWRPPALQIIGCTRAKA
eukprot:1159432-Pelagomonas_calceolata.AAC.7